MTSERIITSRLFTTSVVEGRIDLDEVIISSLIKQDFAVLATMAPARMCSNS